MRRRAKREDKAVAVDEDGTEVIFVVSAPISKEEGGKKNKTRDSGGGGGGRVNKEDYAVAAAAAAVAAAMERAMTRFCTSRKVNILRDDPNVDPKVVSPPLSP